MKLRCDRCGKRWDYNGKNSHYASCPDCKHSVKIKEVG